MIQLIERILQWLRGGSLKLLILAGVILLISGTLSPIGTLVWWLSQEAENLGFKKDSAKQIQPSKNQNVGTAKLNCYIIFLTGVGDFSTNELTPGEEIFLNGLDHDHANCVIVRDVFPYSVANKGLGGERFLAPLWSFANKAEGWLGAANVLIKVRNLWRFAISADERYGPVYNQGIASAIINRMNAAQPIPQNPRQPLKLILIGTSGGGQVALGATQYLDEWLDAQIVVVSVGGVFNGINGFDAANHVYHLWGSRDWVDNIGSIVFPSRWSLTFASPFNQALQQGDYQEIMTGYHEHDGSEGYFGEKIARANRIRYVDLTLQRVNQLPIWSMQKRDDVSSSD